MYKHDLVVVSDKNGFEQVDAHIFVTPPSIDNFCKNTFIVVMVFTCLSFVNKFSLVSNIIIS